MFDPDGLPSNEAIDRRTPEQIAEERGKNADKMIDDFLALKENERVLFMTDENPNNTDRGFIDVLKAQLSERKIEFDELVANDKTKQSEIKSAFKKANLIWDSWDMEDTAKGVDFDKLTDYLEKTGKRMAWCPGVRAESLDDGGSLTESKQEMEERLERMEHKLQDAVGFHIKSNYGTDLSIKLNKGNRRWIKDAGSIEEGNWDNLPGGEIYTTPGEQEVEGTLVLPVLQDEVTLDQGVDEFVRLTFVHGKLRRIDGGASAGKLRKYLEEKSAEEKVNPENVLQCAEIAFGANSKARTAVKNPEGKWDEKANPTIETEKRLGTMHIAIGSNTHGSEGGDGTNESDVHIDFVLPRNGLTVEKFSTEDDYNKKRNGERLINEGSWNFV